MSSLHVLMPSLAQAGKSPEFRCWLARGDRLSDLPGARTAVTRDLFHFAGEAIPQAALRHHCHADDAGSGSWLCADPAYVRSEATAARLVACPVGDLSQAESMALADTLRPSFGDAGLPLAVDTPVAWCVRLAEGAPLPDFAPPREALGVVLIDCLPQGQAGRRWRHLFNEVQIALHAHPGNAERIAAGKVPVNALWFWGPGPLPGAVDTRLQLVASRDDALRGLAKVAGVASTDPEPAALGSTRHQGDVLLDLAGPGDAEGADAWFSEFRRWLGARRFDAIVLTFADGPRFRLRRAHRWRVWRRA